MADSDATEGPAPQKTLATKTAGVKKPVAVKAAPLKKAATRPAPTAKPAAATGSARLKTKAGEAGATIRKEAVALRDQATERARGAATAGKDRATGALDNVAKLIGDAAGTVDDKVGAQYGDYTRKAAEAVAAFATSLKDKEVDDIVKDAAEFVKKSPAVAIGAAAAIGFVIARLVKAGEPETAPANPSKIARKAAPRKKSTGTEA